MINVAERLADRIEYSDNISNIPLASEILHAIDEELSGTSSALPKGTTLADAWVAAYGDPMTSIDAAMWLVKLYAPLSTLGITTHNDGWVSVGLYPVKGPYDKTVYCTGDTIPLALVTAILKYKAKEINEIF